jgi:ATP-dependent Clp protease adapter protein ClpS
MDRNPPNQPQFPSNAGDSFGNNKRRPGPLPRWQLVLVNNENADLMLVVRAIMELTRYCREEATHKMWKAHHCGKAILLMTHRERAELYVEQFAHLGLVVKVEPECAEAP